MQSFLPGSVRLPSLCKWLPKSRYVFVHWKKCKSALLNVKLDDRCIFIQESPPAWTQEAYRPPASLSPDLPTGGYPHPVSMGRVPTSSLDGGYPYPTNRGVPPSSLDGVPPSSLDRGYPPSIPDRGTPSSLDGGYSHLVPMGGTNIQSWPNLTWPDLRRGYTLSWPQKGVPPTWPGKGDSTPSWPEKEVPPVLTWEGVPLVLTWEGGTSHADLGRGYPPCCPDRSTPHWLDESTLPPRLGLDWHTKWKYYLPPILRMWAVINRKLRKKKVIIKILFFQTFANIFSRSNPCLHNRFCSRRPEVRRTRLFCCWIIHGSSP